MSSTIKLASEVAAMLDRDPILCDQVVEALGTARLIELFPKLVVEIYRDMEREPVEEFNEALDIIVKPGTKAFVLEAFRIAGIHV